MENKYKEIFKTQALNLVNDLILVFPNDIFIEKVKEDLIIYLKDENFSIKLKEYFTLEIEECIINKELEILLGTNQFILPTSKENIAKLKFQRYWSSLNNINKDKVWSYLNLLLKLYKNM
tara:strand:+ start:539 stop:898 length:360 start_codon:yes stop_codon:yes gene_type:complete